MAKVYVYQAGLLCEMCGMACCAEIIADGRAPESRYDESTYDSDDYPKGPYTADEADRACHCDDCGVFLENPLTEYGLREVTETIKQDVWYGKTDTIAITEWAPFYDIDVERIRRVYAKDGVTVHVENSDDDPTTVMYHVQDDLAEEWADNDQYIDGNSWESADGPDFVYAMGTWHPKLFDELKAEGYDLDFSSYSEPDERDVDIARHAAECPHCEYDWHKAENHYKWLEDAHFDRFDICAAYNLYAMLYGHDDYTNRIQARLAKLNYRPSRSDEFVEHTSDNARAILRELVRRRHGDQAVRDLITDTERR